MTGAPGSINAKGGGPESEALAMAADIADVDYFLFPLTPQQTTMWETDRRERGTAIFNGAFRLALQGQIDAQLLDAALNALVERHEILRANCRTIDGVPMLAVAERRRIALKTIDLRGRDDAEAEIDRLCSLEARTGFDLERDPLCRFGLITIADDRAMFTLTLHNMVCDGYSISILLSELADIYGALRNGEPVELAEPEIQFGDYSQWVSEETGSSGERRKLAYWRRQLAGYKRLDIPGDMPLDDRGGRASDIVSVELPRALSDKVLQFSSAQGGTFFTTALTACFGLLNHETGASDLSVGTPAAGRMTAEIERMVGPVINHVLVRVRGSGDPTLRELLEATKESVVDSFAYQDVPLENVVQALADDGCEAGEPPFTVSFVCQKGFTYTGTQKFSRARHGFDVVPVPSKSQGALHDLFFFLIEREEGWRASLEYAAGRYSRAYAERLLQSYCQVLERICDRPDSKVSDVGLPPVVRDAPVVAVDAAADLGEADEAGAGEEIALMLPVSFAQERMWILSLAAPDSSTFNMGATLALDGLLDADLLQSCFKDLVGRHEILRTSFQDVDGVLKQIIHSDVDFALERSAIDQLDDNERERRITSVVAETIGRAWDLTRAPLIRAHLIATGPDQHVLVMAMHHIVSDGQSFANIQRELWESYSRLRQGERATLADPDLQFADYADWQRNWVTSEAAEAQRAFWRGTLSGQLPVLDFPLDHAPSFGGDGRGEVLEVPLAGDLEAKLRKRVADENCTMFAVTAAAFAALLSRYSGQYDILFGSPIANRTAETETMIGPFSGPLALRFGLTGESTLSNVLAQVRDGLMDALSNVEYPFERILEDVDVRGVAGRNPLFQFYFLYQKAFVREQEIDGLRMKPLPAKAMATPYELQLGLIERETGITAQLVYNPVLLDRPTIDSIAAYYLDVLAHFASDPGLVLDALPAPQVKPESYRLAAGEETQQSFVAPRTETEARLAEIWAELFKRPEIGVNDDFFALGGRSILAARLIAQVAREFGVRLNISVLVRSRTIAQLGSLLDGEDKVVSNLVALKTTGQKRPLFLMHCGGGHLLRYQEFVEAMPDDQPIYGLCAPPIGQELAQYNVEKLAALYISEIRAVQPHGPYRLGGYSFGGLLAYEIASQLLAAGEEVGMLAIFDTANPVYYRNLPSKEKNRMRRIHRSEVVSRYASYLIEGKLEAARANLQETIENRWRDLKLAVAQRFGGGEAAARSEEVEDNLPIFAAITEKYVPRPYPGSILLFYAEERGREYRNNPSLGWEGLARGGVLIRYVPGTHYTFMQQPHVETLVSKFGRFQDVSRI